MRDYRLHEHFTNKPVREVWSDAARAAALAARRAKMTGPIQDAPDDKAPTIRDPGGQAGAIALWPRVKAEFKKALALKSQIRRAGWFKPSGGRCAARLFRGARLTAIRG